MPRKVNHSKRPEYVALEIMKVGQSVTPSEIDAHVGVGKYSSKYISFLKRDGYVINVTKDGRNVVSYTLVSKPAVEPAASQGRVAPVKMAKAAKAKTPKAEKPKKEKPVKAAKPEKAPKAPAKAKKSDGFVLPAKKKAKVTKPAVERVESFSDTPEMTSYAVDPEFDSATDFDPRDLA